MKLSVKQVGEDEVGDGVPQATPVRVGILGYSDIAQRKFIPALLQSRQAVLVSIASRDRDRGAATFPGVCRSIMNYQELIESPDVDLVYISLPNHLHEEWAVRTLKEGKHVLCEKPLGLSLRSVNRMIDCAQEHGLLLFENLMYLQHPQHSVVKGLLVAGQLGRITGMKSVFRFPGPRENDFRLDPSLGGGAFHDLNRYPLSAALYFLMGSSYRLLHCSAVSENGLNLAVQASYVTSSDELFSLSIGFGSPYESYYEIEGDSGSLRVDRAFTTPADMAGRVMMTRAGQEISLEVAPSDHFLRTIDYVCTLLRSGGAFVEEHTRSRMLAHMAEEMIRASEGRIV